MRRLQIGKAAFKLLFLTFAALCACGSPKNAWETTGDGGLSSSGGSGSGVGVGSGSGSGISTPGGGDGGLCLICAMPDATVIDAGNDAPSTIPTPAPGSVGTIAAPDCPGCTFPAPNAPSCPNAPAIKLVYPNDSVLVPPNLNVISVQWTPFGTPFSRFDVSFSQSVQSPATDWHIVTACKTQTIDSQSGNPSGGCEVVVDPVSWSRLVGANRGLSNPIAITVRGTTDGVCASTSTNTIHMSVADEDLLGTYYYWKSTISSNGVGGQIWAKVFGDLANPEKDVTAKAVSATCNGCHSLSRDGSRMVIYSDDDDSDDEYSDVAGSYLDMTTMPNATEFPGGIGAKGGNGGGGQPPGFSTINPQATYYVSSNGYGLKIAGKSSGASNGYPALVTTSSFSEWSGVNGTFVGPVPIGVTGTRPTMPDWSIDGTSVVYVIPAGGYDAAWQKDDAHIFGGSLYTAPYTGNGAFGAGSVFLQSHGENNYYPSYSPDQPMSYIIFNRVASMGANATCSGGFCLDDSFSNPAARLMLIANAANSTPIDLEKANGSPAATPLSWSNSYPRWAPFLQSYHGNKILWFTFSSTRDYGIRVLNQKTGLYQCYPADAAETPGASHNKPFAPQCKEPQLWMAPLTFTEGQSASADPSGVAFWIPQDIATHNHTAQWTWQPNPPPTPPDAGVTGCSCSVQNGHCGASNGGCGCCTGLGLVCTGSGLCIKPPS